MDACYENWRNLHTQIEIKSLPEQNPSGIKKENKTPA